MKKMTGQQVRETWLKFFQSKGHHVEKGASLIPYNDQTLKDNIQKIKKRYSKLTLPSDLNLPPNS